MSWPFLYSLQQHINPKGVVALLTLSARYKVALFSWWPQWSLFAESEFIYAPSEPRYAPSEPTMPQVNLKKLCPKWARIYARCEPLAHMELYIYIYIHYCHLLESFKTGPSPQVRSHVRRSLPGWSRGAVPTRQGAKLVDLGVFWSHGRSPSHHGCFNMFQYLI